jgi:hypothetical protein
MSHESIHLWFWFELARKVSFLTECIPWMMDDQSSNWKNVCCQICWVTWSDIGIISDATVQFGLVQANFWTLNLGPGSAILDWTSALFGDSSGNITFCRTWFQVQFNQFLNFEPDFSQVHQGSGPNCGITIYNTALLVGEVHFMCTGW